jgi:predicted MFS family arabinose efflux permease
MSTDDLRFERKMVLLLAAVSFVNVLDFIMVMPLGPNFAQALGIPTARLGIIGGSYTAAAALAGLVGTLFLERFDRRSALAVAMLGLVTATAAGGLARSFPMLVAARVMAGIFGGPATSIGMAIITDVVPPQRRGKALGQVMGAFAAASVLGIFTGVRLAIWGGWRAPFFAVAGLGLVVVLVAIAIMPPMRAHLARRREAEASRPLGVFLVDGTVLLSLAGTVAVNMGTFLIVPNLSAWVQQNLGLPLSDIGNFYLVGGLVSFVTMRMGGVLVDRRGSLPVTIVGCALMGGVVAVSFLTARPLIPVMAVFASFMVANSLRAVALNTLSTRVPLATERARFMSAQSAAQHFAAAAGAMISSVVLVNDAGGALVGMGRLGLLSLGLALTVPVFVALVDARVRRRPVLASAQAAAG